MSRTLAEGFAARDDVELVVLGSRNYDERETGEDDVELDVVRCFDVELWNRYGHRALDVETILDLGLDLIHVQFENVLFQLDRLHELMARFDGPVFVTYHDSCNPPSLRHYDFTHAFTHRAGVGPGSPEVIPFPIRKLPAIVRTFGLGRTREDVIAPICDRNGWVFESFATSEQALGGQAWKPWRELHDWLRGADAIVLFYDENGMAGSSQAARTAIATRRPVVVNDTSWFAELESTGNLWKVRDEDELERTLRNLLADSPLMGFASVERVVDLHVQRYREALA
jgi:glycosyltransferase involved in cell wall biosynthesis